MRAEERGNWLLLYRDVEGIGTRLEFAERVFRDIEEYLSKTQKVASRARALLTYLGGTEIGGVVKLPIATQTPWKTLLEKSFEDLVESKDSQVVFFWDELPFMIDKIRRTEGAPAAMEVLDALRSLRQTHSQVRMVFCGSIGMHHITGALRAEGHTNPALNDLFPMPLPRLALDDAVELVTRLASGEGLQCEDLGATATILAESVDCVPFYIHSVIKELAVRRAKVTPDEVERIVAESIVATHDPWHLRHFEERLASYYGAEREPLAGALLDQLSIAQLPLSLQDLQQSIASNPLFSSGDFGPPIQAGDLTPLRTLLNDLAEDHYVSRVPASGRYVFHFPLIKKWWAIHRGLV
jgi:hypothetical protein